MGLSTSTATPLSFEAQIWMRSIDFQKEFNIKRSPPKILRLRRAVVGSDQNTSTVQWSKIWPQADTTIFTLVVVKTIFTRDGGQNYFHCGLLEAKLSFRCRLPVQLKNIFFVEIHRPTSLICAPPNDEARNNACHHLQQILSNDYLSWNLLTEESTAPTWKWYDASRMSS